MRKIMSSKKAGVKQIFTFLMIAILIGLIFLFGLRAISGITEDTCQADTILFTKTLNDYIQRYNTFGSVRIENLNIPCDYDSVCFVSASKIDDSSFDANNNMINESVRAGVERNVFLMKGNIATPISFSSQLEAKNDFICISPIGRRLTIRFEGKGRTVLITDPNQESG
jgi:hypothetical protein